jgi:hypothetical protein
MSMSKRAYDTELNSSKIHLAGNRNKLRHNSRRRVWRATRGILAPFIGIISFSSPGPLFSVCLEGVISRRELRYPGGRFLLVLA